MRTYLVGGAVRDEMLGLPVRERDWLVVGGTPEDNANAFRALLGGAQSAYRDAVLLNAAAALVVAGAAGDLRQGVAMARESIDSGAAKAKIAAVAQITQRAG